MDKMTLEFYEKIYSNRKSKGMYLIKTNQGMLLVKNGKKICFTDKEYSALKDLLKKL